MTTKEFTERILADLSKNPDHDETLTGGCDDCSFHEWLRPLLADAISLSRAATLKEVEHKLQMIRTRWQSGILRDEKVKYDFELDGKPRLAYNAMGLVCDELKTVLHAESPHHRPVPLPGNEGQGAEAQPSECSTDSSSSDLCTCGHERISHRRRMGEGELISGCRRRDCPCPKFTPQHKEAHAAA